MAPQRDRSVSWLDLTLIGCFGLFIALAHHLLG